MYKQGELKYDQTTDSRTDDYDRGMAFFLPHSCGEWVIGGAEEARQLIKDLEEIIEKMNQPL